MTQIIFTGALGFLFLIGFSLFFVWLDERAKKRATQKSNDRFQYFDKNYMESEKKSEEKEPEQPKRKSVKKTEEELSLQD